jgi:glutamate dehydrogenase (NAD(P)+)
MARARSDSSAPTRVTLLESRDVVDDDVDLLGPQKVVLFENSSLGAKAILVTHNTARGPAIGGIRFAADVTPREVYELARAMTWKNAAALIPHGGAKSSIVANPTDFPHGSTERRALVEWFAECLAPFEEYIPGPDMNTDERDMEVVFARNRRSIGRSGIIPLDMLGLTALGALHSYRVLVREGFVDGLTTIEGTTMSIEGFGNVGSALARYAGEAGVTVIAASDLPDASRDYGGVVYDPNGLDVDRLLALRAEGKSVVDTDQSGVEVLRGRANLDRLFAFRADVVVPAARTNSVGIEQARTMSTRVVLEAANGPLTSQAEEYLDSRGVVVTVDYLVNCGGVIGGAEEWAEQSNPLGALRIPHCIARIVDVVAENMGTVHKLARAQGISPRAAATEIVRPRIG